MLVQCLHHDFYRHLRCLMLALCSIRYSSGMSLFPTLAECPPSSLLSRIWSSIQSSIPILGTGVSMIQAAILIWASCMETTMLKWIQWGERMVRANFGTMFSQTADFSICHLPVVHFSSFWTETITFVESMVFPFFTAHLPSSILPSVFWTSTRIETLSLLYRQIYPRETSKMKRFSSVRVSWIAVTSYASS